MRKRYVPVVGPRLKKLLFVVLGLFALLGVNSAYMVGMTAMEAATGRTYQNWFYLVMFLLHLALGALIVVPVLVFGVIHLWNAINRPNKRAVVAGIALFTTTLALLVTGILLTRIEGVIVINDPTVRSALYWAHIVTPLVAVWLFVLHRLAGRRIKWNVGLRWAAVAVVFAGILLLVQAQDPRRWNVEGPKSGEQYFFPSLARTSTGDFIPERVLADTQYCRECHPDTHDAWASSVHRFSSFNNPPYLFSVRETRKVSLERDGNLQAARWCAGCHDPVVFYSGKFDDPEFDDQHDPAGQAGITCTVCHAISHVNSPRGNADYTIEEPIHYPFAYSQNATLRWINRQLIKAKPEFHKKTFLKPHHKTAEFCSTCHKVHLPVELNQYKFLRGQNHYDSFLLSGVSGHGVQSFYYPPKAQANCAGCHMPLKPSADFGAKHNDDSGAPTVHHHFFPAANIAIPTLVGAPAWAVEEHRKFNEGVIRVDLFGVREDGSIDGELHAPLRPAVPTLRPGRRYLVEAVVRTVKMGHHFTQGTVDSNEVWMDVTVKSGDRVIGRSGGQDPSGRVDPWSHFVNVYMLDREGRRIDRRNPQDIFVPLYDHQIPPGAADVLHYLIEVPPDVGGAITVEAKLRYRKFDTTYMKHVYGADYENVLPVLELAQDAVTFPVGGDGSAAAEIAAGNATPAWPEWERWNDYGIGLLRKGGKSKGQLRQAEVAFQRVEALGRPDGPLNLARLHLAQGTVEDLAVEALARAASFDPKPPAWSLAWWSGLVDKQNGKLDEAIASFKSVALASSPELRERGFDFSKDYNLLNELGLTLHERAKQERGEAGAARRAELLREAVSWFDRTLAIDPENVTAHFNLYLLAKQLGDQARANTHFEAYKKYKPDDNARDRAIAVARAADPAANHAAEAIVLYDLQRPGAFELPVEAYLVRQEAPSG
jgi:tetratricopeptide (TPR) repeat protein